MEIKIKVKCVGCGATKTVGKEQGSEQPMCDKCYEPMIAVEAKVVR